MIDWVRAEFDEGPEAEDRVEARPWGYEVSTQSRAYLETGDFLSMSIGNGPFIVDGSSGEVWSTGSNPLEHHGEGNVPGWSRLDDVATFTLWRRHRPAGITNVLDLDDPAGVEQRLIARHAREHRMSRFPFPEGEPDGVFWSDMETGLFFRSDGPAWVYGDWQRGRFTDRARFSHRDDAERMLLIDIARPRTRYTARASRPDVSLDPVDGLPALSWGDRQAVFLVHGESRRDRFLPFVDAPLAEIASSLSGITDTRWITYVR